MFERRELPFCMALFVEPWNSPVGRYFVAYRARHGFRAVIGNGVADEFRTVSAPIFISPTALLGKIYDAGMAMADRRDVALPIDLGWPPLCIGLEVAAPALATNWRDELLNVLTDAAAGQQASWPIRTESRLSGEYELEYIRCGGPAIEEQVTIVGTTAPLLPGQLERLADIDRSGLTVAIATGNRITRQNEAAPQQIEVLSEAALRALLNAAGALLAQD